MVEITFAPFIGAIISGLSLFVAFKIMGSDITVIRFILLYIVVAAVSTVSTMFLGTIGIIASLVAAFILYSIFAGLSLLKVLLAVIISAIISFVLMAGFSMLLFASAGVA